MAETTVVSETTKTQKTKTTTRQSNYRALVHLTIELAGIGRIVGTTGAWARYLCDRVGFKDTSRHVILHNVKNNKSNHYASVLLPGEKHLVNTNGVKYTKSMRQSVVDQRLAKLRHFIEIDVRNGSIVSGSKPSRNDLMLLAPEPKKAAKYADPVNVFLKQLVDIVRTEVATSINEAFDSVGGRIGLFVPAADRQELANTLREKVRKFVKGLGVDTVEGVDPYRVAWRVLYGEYTNVTGDNPLDHRDADVDINDQRAYESGLKWVAVEGDIVLLAGMFVALSTELSDPLSPDFRSNSGLAQLLYNRASRMRRAQTAALQEVTQNPAPQVVGARGNDVSQVAESAPIADNQEITPTPEVSPVA